MLESTILWETSILKPETNDSVTELHELTTSLEAFDSVLYIFQLNYASFWGKMVV